ncbi:hypothetical protein [Nonomuraea endophytica]|uniref:Uncharacterized protein n=1 Tax=Nonomuraea endophytica TaxID=714136 RepID=A0A7W8A5N2_9ACTN|nr:hypothetical protein [Nonomuraea endophytica]MBB5079310.1 hypothetical protein [Nonomuraea endophytica]
MTVVYDLIRRITAAPELDDLARGFRAEIADPAWMLGRQWQLGEHQGEDASSPVQVDFRRRLTPIEADGGHDPVEVPAEAIVESEPYDWWTPGRRVALGRRVAAAFPALPGDPALMLGRLPVPYDGLTGYDGRTLWIRREQLGLDASLFGPVPPPLLQPADLWDPAAFEYDADFTAGNADLTVRRHSGGDLDWFSADAELPAGSGGQFTGGEERPCVVRPGRVRYPGAPLPRWWQIEDGAVDIGGYPPDRSHFATLLLIDLVVNQSDDWFTFPVDAMAGHVVTLSQVRVCDSFGQEWPLSPPADGWSLYATEGLGRDSLVVWTTAATPLAGPVLDEVVVGIDEDANAAWAVERRIGGRDVSTPADPAPTLPGHPDMTGPPVYDYALAARVPEGWHPYLVGSRDGRRRFVRHRAADLSGAEPAPMPDPRTDLLSDAGARPHVIEPGAIPVDGARLERRAMLARATTGDPVLWTQRRRTPLLTPPAIRLRFDALVPGVPERP